MRQKLYEYLLDRPAGASPHELLDLIFTQPGADPEFGPHFLRTLLAPDSRFVWRPADCTWSVRAHQALARRLHDTCFVVVDIETTGVGTSADGIIEIGAARVHAGRVLEEFQQLINPGVRLSPFITQLTGIADAMLCTQPRLAEVWPRFLAFLGDNVLIAHNARYDLAFLNAASEQYAGRPLTNLHLCTLKLARHLIPESRRRGLDALAAYFGIPQTDRHRALGDVRITVEVFFQLLERLAARRIDRLDQALDLQHQARDGRRFVCVLPRATVERLPTAPGIYQFFDAAGKLLYIGKAKNLRQRVSSYLSNAAGHSDKTLDLIRHSHDVRVQVAGSELDAALEEADAIRRHKPPYNRLRKHLPRIAFLKLTVAAEYPRLSITDRLAAGTAEHVGPFRNRDEAGRMLALLTRLFRLRTCAGTLRPDAAATPCLQGQVGACSEPCTAAVSIDSYRQQVSACLTMLRGDAAAAEHQMRRLIERRDRLAEALRFEAAANAQRDIDALERLTRRQRTLGWVAARQHFLILQPAADRRSVLAYLVLGGRLALRRQLSDEAEIGGLAEQARQRFAEYEGTTLRRDEVDGTTILAAWLRDRGETDGCVLRIENSTLPATQITEWRAVCASLLPPRGNADQRAPSHPQDEGQSEEYPRA